MSDPIRLIRPPRYAGTGKSVSSRTWTRDTPIDRLRFLFSALGDDAANGPEAVNARLLDIAVQARVDELIPMIAERIASGTTGYLLRLNYYIDPNTGARRPSTMLVSALGVGTEPLDALAESYRTPAIGGAEEGRREHVYLWCTRLGEAFEVTCPDVAGTERLEAEAKEEALRRNVLGHSFSTDAVKNLQNVKRAALWQDLVRERQYLDAAVQDQRRLQSLNRRFQASLDRLNDAYADFQATQREMARRAEEAQFLQRISVTLSLVQSGLEAAGETAGPFDEDSQRRWDAAQMKLLGKANSDAARNFNDFAARARALEMRFREEMARIKLPPAQPLVLPELM